MSTKVTRRITGALVISLLTLFGGGMSDYILPANSQTQPELKKFNPQIVTEEGCPIEVLQANTQMEVDPFGTPIAARHYIDYRNAGSRPVAAVKFRIGYVDDDGRVQLPYLNAPDAHSLNPGEQASQKWRGDHVGARTASIKIRVLMVKFSDGTVWESQKVQANDNQQPQQQGFVPLQTESQMQLLSDRIPGTPVQFHDYGSQQYKAYPDKTATGAVPLSSPQGLGAPPSVNGFEAAPTTGAAPMAAGPMTAAPMTASPMSAAPMTASPMNAAPITASPMNAAPMTASPMNAAPMTASPMNAAPMTASPMNAAPMTASPMNAAPMTASPMNAPAQPGAASPAAPVDSFGLPASAPAIATPATPMPPAAAAPMASPPAVTAPASSYAPPTAGAKGAATVDDPLAVFDSLVGGKKPAPVLAPQPAPATTGSAAAPQPQMAPAPDSQSDSGI